AGAAARGALSVGARLGRDRLGVRRQQRPDRRREGARFPGALQPHRQPGAGTGRLRRALAEGRSVSAPFDLVAIVASAGGLQAMERILAGLPGDFPLPIALVQHRITDKPDVLAKVLARHTRLRVKLAEEGETLRPGTVYVALPTLHLHVDADRTLHHVDGVRVRHVLSSGDRLFESAARALGGRVIGVVLTGYDKDGTAGARAIHAAGGFVIAQDAASALAPPMPLGALETGCVDAVLPLDFIAPALVTLAVGTYARRRLRAANDEASRKSSNGD